MKKFLIKKNLGIVCLLFIFLFSFSCSSDDDTTDNTNPGELPLDKLAIEFRPQFAVGKTIEIGLETLTEKPIAVDFGDGKPIRFATDENSETIAGKIVSKNIKIYINNPGDVDTFFVEGGVETINVTQVTSLRYLNIAGPYTPDPTAVLLKTIDLTKNPKLTSLSVQNNALTNIDLSNKAILTNLNISNNNLSSINLKSLPLLSNLNLDNNPNLTAVDISGNPELSSVKLSYNEKLTSLNVTKQPKIKSLQLYRSPITTLNLTFNTLLEDLGIESTKIAAIDLSKNTNLEKFNASNAPLTSLSFTNNKKLSLVRIHRTSLNQVALTSALNTLHNLNIANKEVLVTKASATSAAITATTNKGWKVTLID